MGDLAGRSTGGAPLSAEQQAAVDALTEPTPLESIAAFAAITGDTITTTAIAAGATVATGAYT